MPDPGTYLAFDFGTRSIGVAVGQTLTTTCNPLKALAAKDGIPHWPAVAELVQQWQPVAFIVGLPLHMHGAEGDLVPRVRKFGGRLQGRYGKPWIAMDERLSTFVAKQQARELGHKGNYHQDPIDSLAAAAILQSWFELEFSSKCR